jgi:hypothetical protein
MKRLLEDPQLSAALRGDLLRSRSAGQAYPTAEKLLQLRAAFSDSVPPVRQPSPSPSTVATRLLHPGWKLALIAALGGGGGAVLYGAAGSAPQPVAAAVAMQVVPASSELEGATSLAEPTLAEPAPALPEPPAPAAALPEPAEMVRAAGTEAAGRAGPDAVAGRSARREIAQLVRIRALLDRDPVAAQRLAARSEREFPRGLLTEERKALAIVALAKSGSRDLAAREARKFLARYPQSTMREQLEAAVR